MVLHSNNACRLLSSWTRDILHNACKPAASAPASCSLSCKPSLCYGCVQAAGLSPQAQQDTSIPADLHCSWSSFVATGHLCASSAGLLPGRQPITPPLPAAVQQSWPVSDPYTSAPLHSEADAVQQLCQVVPLQHTWPEASMSAPSAMLSCSILEQQASEFAAIPQPMQTGTSEGHQPQHERGAVLAESPAGHLADTIQFFDWAEQWLQLPGDDLCCGAGQPQHAMEHLLLPIAAPERC